MDQRRYVPYNPEYSLAPIFGKSPIETCSEFIIMTCYIITVVTLYEIWREIVRAGVTHIPWRALWEMRVKEGHVQAVSSVQRQGPLCHSVYWVIHHGRDISYSMQTITMLGIVICPIEKERYKIRQFSQRIRACHRMYDFRFKYSPLQSCPPGVPPDLFYSMIERNLLFEKYLMCRRWFTTEDQVEALKEYLGELRRNLRELVSACERQNCYELPQPYNGRCLCGNV